MSKLWHKTESSIRNNTDRAKSFVQLKSLLILLYISVAVYFYTNWQSCLEKLDSQPISAFALLGTPTFTTDDDVRDALQKFGSLKGFFGQDIDVLGEQIQTMPWIREAVVRKIWPNRLSIMVSEYTPVATWNETEFLSDDGVIFKLPADKLKAENLPQLFGPDYQSSLVMEAWHKIYHDLRLKGLKLKAVSIDDRGAWQITLDNDVQLKLGRGEWKSKLDRFATIYPQIEIPEHKKLSYVDLRYKVGAAVGFKDVDH
ncbi:cell division protein FtsQ/DivIB [Seminibacterium arietis]|uniref:Cell division protein FtsQ n=1 Tax=Seminibacterium arietis TaxID=1173502 RepID=A0ABW3I7I2_9PAST